MILGDSCSREEICELFELQLSSRKVESLEIFWIREQQVVGQQVSNY